MAYREVSRVEIAEVVRRWQSGISQRGISTGTGLSRATVRRYIDAAVEAGLARDGPAPSEEQLTRLAGLSVAGPRKVEIPTEEVLAPWADQGLRVAHRRPVAGDPHPRAACGPGLPGLVHVVEAVHRAAGLAEGGVPRLSGWERAHPARWRRWTSAVWV